MGRLIAGIIVGVIAAFAAIWAIEMVHHMLYPIPASVTLNDTAGLGEFTRTLPLASQLFIAFGWLVGSAVGGVVAARIARRDSAIFIVAGVVALAGLGNVLWLPHPLLLQIASVAAPALGALLARRLAGGRLAAQAPGTAEAQ
ncbi:MAG TPA: hypothetical protein VEZ70_12055 [Allosphingosinicella sp.]|nr:hypothetical protein [Allosphingosinicella sp.]